MSSAPYCAKRHKPERRTCGWLLAFAATQFTASASADQTLRSNRKRQNNANGVSQGVPTQGSVAQHSNDEDLQRALQRVASGLAKSNIDGALAMLGSLRREFPLNPHYHAAAANLLAKQGHNGAARQLASEAAALDPGEPGYVQVCSKSDVDHCAASHGRPGRTSPIAQLTVVYVGPWHACGEHSTTLVQLLADLVAQGGSVAAARDLHKSAAELPDAVAPHLVGWVRSQDMRGPEHA